MLTDSAHKLWHAFLGTHPDVDNCLSPKTLQIETDHKDGIRKLDHILKGRIKAFSIPLLALQKKGEALPSKGSFSVVQDGKGNARAIIQTTEVRLRPLFNVTLSFIELEGAGFNTHDAWKKGVWERFAKDLAPFGKVPHDSTIVVCETFNVVFIGK
ncbi:MAG: hypothetical protein RLZZ241_1658 [Bacteroidota bacterium]|jgi:uncharacterized protein YhfF